MLFTAFTCLHRAWLLLLFTMCLTKVWLCWLKHMKFWTSCTTTRTWLLCIQGVKLFKQLLI